MVAHAVVPIVGRALVKRLVDEPPKNIELPPWSGLIALVNSIIFLLPFVWIVYTLGTLLPTLAIVEDPNPPAYEQLASNDDVETAGTGPNKKNLPAVPGADGKPITSSVRATHRLLKTVGGFRGRFRGIMAALALGVAISLVRGFVKLFRVPEEFGDLAAWLALVQLSAAWVHIIMTVPNPLPFWRRLPPFRRTFEATCFPTLAAWAAVSLSRHSPMWMAALLRLDVWDPAKNPNEVPEYHRDAAWKGLTICLVSLAITFLLVMPTQVALVRVQASLLSPDEQTIVPFDFTFQGKVGPVVVDGKGYATLRDALSTFSRASWIRLYKMYIKVTLISVAALIVLAIALGLQVFLVTSITGGR